MTDHVRALFPGVQAIFSAKGYLAAVSQSASGGIAVTVYKTGGVYETRTFPIPASNRELSRELLLWRDELP